MKPPVSIYTAMMVVWDTAPDLDSADLNALYDQLHGLITKEGLLCLVEMIDTKHSLSNLKNAEYTSVTTVDTCFTFIAADDSRLSARATGVYVDSLTQVTNYALLQATRHALLSVFGLCVGSAPSRIEQAKQNVSRVMDKAGLTGTVMTADQLESKKPEVANGPPVPVITKPVLPATSKLPTTPVLPAVMTPEAKSVADWISGIDKLNPEAPGEWDVHRLALKTLVLTDDEKLELFKKLQEAGWNLGVDYNTDRRMFFLAEPHGGPSATTN